MSVWLDSITEGDETKRLEMQARLDELMGPSEKNRLGQFGTPTELATDILAYAAELMKPDDPVRFLDPAVGTGAFYSALLRCFMAYRIVHAVGYEINERIAATAEEIWSRHGLRVICGDFTRAVPTDDETRKPNLLICNPPYVRHHHLTTTQKEYLAREVRRRTGILASGLAGLYCYFIMLSQRWMAQRGLAAWLVPSEFMDVNYGAAVKQFLLSQVTLLRIHRFQPKDVQFRDALVSSVIVWFKNERSPEGHLVEFSMGGSLRAPRQSQAVPVDTLAIERKWTQFPRKGDVSNHTEFKEHTLFSGHTLSDLFTVKRGLATGNNEFFLLTPERARELEIPSEFLQPVLPAPRLLRVNEVEANADGLPSNVPYSLMVNCALPESAVKRIYPALWRYLESGRELGVNLAYLCRHRKPWYSQEHRNPAPFLCTYMGRQRTDGCLPFRFILNRSNAVATNLYLMLYPQAEINATIKADPSLSRRVWGALQQTAAEALVAEGRVYGGGLYKMEPKELGRVPADEVLKILSSQINSS